MHFRYFDYLVCKLSCEKLTNTEDTRLDTLETRKHEEMQRTTFRRSKEQNRQNYQFTGHGK